MFAKYSVRRESLDKSRDSLSVKHTRLKLNLWSNRLKQVAWSRVSVTKHLGQRASRNIIIFLLGIVNCEISYTTRRRNFPSYVYAMYIRSHKAHDIRSSRLIVNYLVLIYDTQRIIQRVYAVNNIIDMPVCT